MNTGVYYHYWSVEGDANTYQNLRSPILLSIATLRATNPLIPIVVLQEHQCQNNWSHFPEKLNFRVQPIEFTLEKHHGDKPGWKHLSRIFDLERYAEHDTVIYSDVDVFWLRDILPLRCDPQKFCFNGNNTGHFYYCQSSDTVQQFFEVFKAFTISALHDETIRDLMKKHAYDAWYYVFDEMIATYMYNEKHKHLFSTMTANDHACIRNIHMVDFSLIKMLHCNGLLVANDYSKIPCEKKHCRGLCCLLFKELYDLICKVLNEKDLSSIFTSRELSYFLPQQFSLEKDYGRILNTKSSDNHYHLQRCLKNNRLLV